jgi:hypothetical protein
VAGLVFGLEALEDGLVTSISFRLGRDTFVSDLLHASLYFMPFEADDALPAEDQSSWTELVDDYVFTPGSTGEMETLSGFEMWLTPGAKVHLYLKLSAFKVRSYITPVVVNQPVWESDVLKVLAGWEMRVSGFEIRPVSSSPRDFDVTVGYAAFCDKRRQLAELVEQEAPRQLTEAAATVAMPPAMRVPSALAVLVLAIVALVAGMTAHSVRLLKAHCRHTVVAEPHMRPGRAMALTHSDAQRLLAFGRGRAPCLSDVDEHSEQGDSARV